MMSMINLPILPKFQNFVDNRLIRGRSVVCPYRLYKMKQQGITQIIDLRNSSYFEAPFEKLFCKLLGIKYLNLPYPARLNYLPNYKFFENINNNILNNKNGFTYIHCKYGQTRTGIAVAIYEKLHLHKVQADIFKELFHYGFKELQGKKTNTIKYQKKQSIIIDLLKKYF